MNKIQIIITVIILFPFITKAQDGGCGTEVSQNQISLETGINLPAVKSHESIPLLNTELAVTVFIVKNDKGEDGISVAAINNAFDKLNTAFAAINLKFRICNTNYVNNYLFNNINVSQNEKDLTTQHFSQNTINLYFVSSLIDKSGTLAAGCTFMPADQKDVILFSKDYISGNELVHQFGHFLGLYHTNETSFGNELVFDANCHKTGDKCCDTPADPAIRGSVDNKCDYTGRAKDAKNNYYIPSTNNYMSLGNDACRCIFTKDQLTKVIYTLQNQKKYLW